MSRKSRYLSSWRPSVRIVKTSVAGTGVPPSTIWNRPPSIGLITSQRSDPPPPSSVAKTRCLPRRESETIRRAGSSLAKCSTGYRSMWPFFGLTVAAVIRRPSRRGLSRIRSASSSGNSGMEPRYGGRFNDRRRGEIQERPPKRRRLSADGAVGRQLQVNEVGVFRLLDARAREVGGVAVAAACQEHRASQLP